MITLSKELQIASLRNLDDAISVWEQSLDYLEKASAQDLGDFTKEGKSRNAGFDNYTLYWKWYQDITGANYQKEPYCAGFVSVMFVTAFGRDIAKKLLCGDLFIYCPTGYNRFKAVGRISSTPQKGAVVFFWSDSLGRWSHTGIVVKVLTDAKGKVTGYVTIEANTSSGANTVVRNGGATCRKSYVLDSKKVAFGLPAYNANGIELERKNREDFVKHSIGTYEDGLEVIGEGLNVRDYPALKYTDSDGKQRSSKIIKKLSPGQKIICTFKAFDDRGVRWYYIPQYDGWCSGNYLTGWIQETPEKKGGWWYLLPDGKYYVNEVAIIDGKAYAFDDRGYMATGRLTIKTDSTGALSVIDSRAETL